MNLEVKLSNQILIPERNVQLHNILKNLDTRGVEKGLELYKEIIAFAKILFEKQGGYNFINVNNTIYDFFENRTYAFTDDNWDALNNHIKDVTQNSILREKNLSFKLKFNVDFKDNLIFIFKLYFKSPKLINLIDFIDILPGNPHILCSELVTMILNQTSQQALLNNQKTQVTTVNLISLLGKALFNTIYTNKFEYFVKTKITDFIDGLVELNYLQNLLLNFKADLETPTELDENLKSYFRANFKDTFTLAITFRIIIIKIIYEIIVLSERHKLMHYNYFLNNIKLLTDDLKIDCNSCLKSYYIAIGGQILFPLTQEGIIELFTSKKQTKNRYEPTYFQIIDKKYEFEFNTQLPDLCLPKITANEKVIINDNYSIDKLNSDASTVSDNYYIKGSLYDSQPFDDACVDSPFCLNRNFAIDFFSYFREILNTPTKHIKQNAQHLQYLSEIYRINFNSLYLNVPQGYDNIYNEIINYAVDFKNFKILDVKLLFKLNHIYENKYQEFFNSILSLIYSTKIIINEMILQNLILNAIQKFVFAWRCDSRGRLYYSASLLSPQGIPLIRNFLSFFKPQTINHLIETDQLTKAQAIQKINEINSKLQNQIRSIYKGELKEYNFQEILNIQNIKFGERFNLYLLLRDFYVLKKILIPISSNLFSVMMLQIVALRC